MDTSTHHTHTSTWMIAAIIFLVISLVEGYYIYHTHAQFEYMTAQKAKTGNTAMRPSGGQRPKPVFIIKGQKFATNPLFSKAYLMFPTTGALSTDAQTALTGWDVKTTANADGATQVDFIPHESGDIKQSFTVKPGHSLYFVEMTLQDDMNGTDENRGDDMGVLVDPNGIVE